MSWKEKVFRDFKLYAVTDLDREGGEILKQIDDAYRGGADIVQLRSKKCADAALYRLGIKIRKLADARKKLFFVNDRLDLAAAVKADGLHVGQDDMPVAALRSLERKLGCKFWLGKSTHSLQQARATVKEPVDYIGVGPVFATPTKPHYEPAGLEFVRQAAVSIKKPFVVIGGIDLSNLDLVLQAGAKKVAVVRAIFGANNSYEAAKHIRARIERYSNAE